MTKNCVSIVYTWPTGDILLCIRFMHVALYCNVEVHTLGPTCSFAILGSGAQSIAPVQIGYFALEVDPPLLLILKGAKPYGICIIFLYYNIKSVNFDVVSTLSLKIRLISLLQNYTDR